MDFFSPNRIRLIENGLKSQTCSKCGLGRGKRHPRMEPFGNFRLRILIVGEAPGEMEDLHGRPWQGKMGRLLRRKLAKLGIDLFEDCLCINACSCRPTNKEGNNRAPTPQEIANCRSRVINVIQDRKPKLIIGLGGSALISLIGSRWQKDLGTISKWRNWAIPDRALQAWLYFTFHPSFTDRGDKEVNAIWTSDLKRGLKLVDKPFPEFEDEKEQVRIVEDGDFIRKLRSPFAFDYETTGLKPHDTTKHHIRVMSICDRPNRAYSFLMPAKGTKFYEQIRELLHDPDYEKIAQNMKYEDTWTRELLRTEVRGWLWDPMLSTHILDNRPGICSLKFQTYVNFGVVDYDSKVAPFLKSVNEKNGNSLNRIDELMKTEKGRYLLRIYCGLDSIFELNLAYIHMKKLGAIA